MTAIQIKYLEYLESKRKNLANESLTAAQIQVERDKLAEAIANNLRTFKVNVSKNQITRLANDQLNDREKAKLSETIRSNLVQENLRLQSLLEDIRSHQKSESIKEKEADIKQYEADIKNNQMLIDSLNSGKSKDLAGKLFDWFRGGINADVITGGQVVDRTVALPIKRAKQGLDVLDKIGVLNFGESTPLMNAMRHDVEIPTRRVRRERDEDEIPNDFSNSRGPGESTVIKVNSPPISPVPQKGRQIYDTPIGPQLPTNKIVAPSAPTVIAGNSAPISQHVNPSSVTSHSGSAVIYSPGSKVGPGWL